MRGSNVGESSADVDKKSGKSHWLARTIRLVKEMRWVTQVRRMRTSADGVVLT